MSDTAQEADVHADGSTTFDETPPPMDNGESFTGDAGGETDELPLMEEHKFAIDPAIFLLLGVAIIIGLYYFFVIKKKKLDDEDEFFADLDGKKFDLSLPSEVDDYYKLRAKCESSGWVPGTADAVSTGDPNSGSAQGRLLAQALMKRAIADIPIVQHIQKEAQGMGKLYARSMCSVNQWRAYQAAEALVSSEVEQVRAEADEIEPGWSEIIWKQAVQYHAMLKQKHEAEAKQQQEKTAKLKSVIAAASSPSAPANQALPPPAPAPAPMSKEQEARAKELAAQRAAEELIKEEEREKNAKKAFASGGGVKKGFLDGKGKKK